MARPLSPDAAARLDQFRPPSPNASVLYLSTPITTGPRLLDWLARNRQSSAGSDPTGATEGPDADIVRDEVIEENLAQLGQLREAIRVREPATHLIDPTTLTVPGWSQAEYHRFWVEVINRFVDRIVFADGWDLSTGCTIEYVAGLRAGLPMQDGEGRPIRPALAAGLLRRAGATLAAAGRDPAVSVAAARHAASAAKSPLKDSQLADLAELHNVANFVSVAPGDPLLRFRYVQGPHVSRSTGLDGALRRLLAVSRGSAVNVRTFKPDVFKGNPFRYGLTQFDEVMGAVAEFAAQGYYCIVNETIAVDDGGVSGVTLGGVAEFAPDDTPRVVEKGATAAMPLDMAQHVIGAVYGHGVTVPADPTQRIEFSVHPGRVGFRSEPVVVWESETVGDVQLDVQVSWPNPFSRLIGDKTYGLLVADALGLPVPATTVVSRRVAPFRFGRATGTGEWWMRTAPAQQTPGHYTTTRGWSDPFAVLAKEDPDGHVAAALAQEGVAARYSGATLPVEGPTGHIIEGVAGAGDDFMLGDTATDNLPEDVELRVRATVEKLEDALGGGVRIEWADDGETVWILQLHRATHRGAPGVFSLGEASDWLSFDPAQGLDALRDLIAQARERGAGIEVTAPIGLTSHVGDLLRKAGVPGRLDADVAVTPEN